MPKIWTSQDSQGTTFQSRRSGLCASGAKWLPGVITTVRGSQSYDITLEDGQITRHHVDHTREHCQILSSHLIPQPVRHLREQLLMMCLSDVQEVMCKLHQIGLTLVHTKGGGMWYMRDFEL